MRSIFVILVSLSAALAVAEEPRPVTIGESFTFHSERLGEDRTIQRHLPRDYVWSGARYPVVYLLDGETNFHHTTGTLDTLSRLGHIPEMIVIAVNNTERTRDLTPLRRSPLSDDEEDRFPTSGGADAFLDFFEDELIPHVEASYRTAPYRVLIGHSFGGLFAVHALVHRSDLFDGYIAISPSLWWDDDQPVRDAKELFAQKPSLSKRLFVSLAEEIDIMRLPYSAFTELLRYEAPDGLQWDALNLDGDDHGTAPIRSTLVGIRALFPLWRLPASESDGGVEALDRHFTRLSEVYGYPIEVPERAINSLGQRLMYEDKPAEARVVFEANVVRYPSSPNVYDSLGESLEASGDVEQAIENFERAVALAEPLEHPSLDVYRRHLDGATSKR